MAKLEFRNVYFEYIKIVNKEVTLKESVVKYILNFGQKTYSNEAFKVLNNINFTLKDGDRLCIIGKNGAGKSTLLRLMTSIYNPTSGNILRDGRITSLIEVGAGMNPELTGRENIYLSGLISGFTKKEIEQKEQEIIDFAGIGEFIDTPIKYYSTGMGYRLSFSIATIISPDILIVDELFASGDLGFIDKATKRLEDLKSESSIFISVSHNMDYAKDFFNKIIYLRNNSIYYYGDDFEYAIQEYKNDF